MNILFGFIWTMGNYHLFKRIVEECKVEGGVVCYVESQKYLEPLKHFLLQNKKNYHGICYKEFYWANYENDPLYEKAPPIDSDILAKMVVYEPEILKMMDRDGTELYHIREEKYLKHLQYWNYILDTKEIDLFVLPHIPHLVYDYIIYCLCKIKKIKFIGAQYLFVPNYQYLIQDINVPIDDFENIYNDCVNMYKNVSEDEIKLPKHVDKVYQQYAQLEPTSNTDTLHECMHSDEWFECLNENGKTRNNAQINKKRTEIVNFLQKNICSYDYDFMKKIERLFNYERAFREPYCYFTMYNDRQSKIESDDKYIYVPLHCQPEASTSPVGGVFVNQLLMIKMLSFYLPEGYFLYIKEHPAQITSGSFEQEKGKYHYTGRSVEFYTEIAKLKNVKLISLKENTYKLIKNSMAVASVSGTALLEGAFLGKPGLIFSSEIKKYIPGIFCVHSNIDCKKALESIFSNQVTITCKDLKIYFKAISKIMYFDPSIEPLEFVKELGQYRSVVEKCEMLNDQFGANKNLYDVYVENINKLNI